jgi:hypothetical protein
MNEWKTQKRNKQIQTNRQVFSEEQQALITSILEYRMLQALDFCYTECTQ